MALRNGFEVLMDVGDNFLQMARALNTLMPSSFRGARRDRTWARLNGRLQTERLSDLELAGSSVSASCEISSSTVRCRALASTSTGTIGTSG